MAAVEEDGLAGDARRGLLVEYDADQLALGDVQLLERVVLGAGDRVVPQRVVAAVIVKHLDGVGLEVQTDLRTTDSGALGVLHLVGGDVGLEVVGQAERDGLLGHAQHVLGGPVGASGLDELRGAAGALAERGGQRHRRFAVHAGQDGLVGLAGAIWRCRDAVANRTVHADDGHVAAEELVLAAAGAGSHEGESQERGNCHEQPTRSERHSRKHAVSFRRKRVKVVNVYGLYGPLQA